MTDSKPTFVLGPRFARAVQYASALHAGQARKSTSIPYMSHLLGAASLVLEAGGDEDMAIAALLHDGPEDQGGQAILDEIGELFGDRVAHIVHGCTDSFEEDSEQKAPWKDRKVAYIKHLSEADQDTLIVSLSDKLHNARSIASDLRISGPITWKRFNNTPKEIMWYYTEILATARAAQAPVFLQSNLNEEVTHMSKFLDE